MKRFMLVVLVLIAISGGCFSQAKQSPGVTFNRASTDLTFDVISLERFVEVTDSLMHAPSTTCSQRGSLSVRFADILFARDPSNLYLSKAREFLTMAKECGKQEYLQKRPK